MVEYDPQERELVKKLDLKLIPFLVCLYFLILMDRSNQLHTGLPNYKTETLLKQHFGIDKGEASVLWSLVAFGFGSLIGTLPTVLVFRKIGPALTFAAILASWGITMVITSVVRQFHSFVFARLCLGLFQSGFVPCILVYIVSFFTREESATRIAYVVSVASIAQSFSELLSDYISQAPTHLELSGWQWVYIIEGISGCFMGLITWLYLPSFPETCKFLNAADRVLAVARGREGYDKEESSLITKPTHVDTKVPAFRFNFLQFFDIIQDSRIWLLSVAYLTIASALDFLMVATPEISAMSFGMREACTSNCTAENIDLSHGISFGLQILSMAPYVIALFVSYFLAVKSDESGDRAHYAGGPLLAAIFGFFILAIVPSNQSIGYFFGIIPAIGGLVSSLPSVFSYAMDHASGDTQRATVAGIVISLGQSLGLLLAAIQQLGHESSTVSSTGVYWINILLLSIGLGCVAGVYQLNVSEEQSIWGKAPGLRRLLNDADEAKAWDVELSNVEDFMKSGQMTQEEQMDKGWESVDEMGNI